MNVIRNVSLASRAVCPHMSVACTSPPPTRLAALPSRLFVGCCALTTLSAHDNPLTVEALRAAEGYQAYDERRRARASKQLDGRVMADTARAFSEGADVLQWERWASGATGLGTDGSGRAGGRR